MESKFFRCYFCKTKNNYFVPAEQNGKECKCCQAFNYFQKNSDNKYINNNYNKKKKGYKYKKFHNNGNKSKKIEFDSNGKFGGTQNNFYKKNYNNFNDELNDNIHPKSNIFSNGINSNINHISNNDNIGANLNYRGFYYNNFLDTQPCLFTTINKNNLFNGVNNNTFNNNPYHRQNNQKPKCNLRREFFKPKPLRNNQSFRNNFYYKKEDEEDKKEDIKKEEEDDDDDDVSLYNYNKIIKYIWLKREKMTNKILEKGMNENQCSVCLRNIKLNHVICITRCGHVFHYKCIEEVIDHHMNVCPNCRCNLKTGEKQKINDKDNTYNYLLSLNFSRFLFEGNSYSDSGENNEYDISDDYNDSDFYDF